MINFVELYNDSVEYLTKEIDVTPDISLVAGSGIYDSLLFDKVIKKIDYRDIPGLRAPEIEGHSSDLILAEKFDKKVLIFTGRSHLYEGCEYHEAISSAIISHKMGIKNIVITNSAGGLNLLYKIGSIMVIEDMMNFSFRQSHHEIMFPPEVIANKKVNIIAENWLKRAKVVLQYYGNAFNSGVYASVMGPNYETPAEIRMYAKFADAIGMSTYHEAACAKLLGLNVLACSVITNLLSPSKPQMLTHDEVLEASNLATRSIASFLDAAIQSI